jgi:hypothetical protein
MKDYIFVCTKTIIHKDSEEIIGQIPIVTVGSKWKLKGICSIGVFLCSCEEPCIDLQISMQDFIECMKEVPNGNNRKR